MACQLICLATQFDRFNNSLQKPPISNQPRNSHVICRQRINLLVHAVRVRVVENPHPVLRPANTPNLPLAFADPYFKSPRLWRSHIPYGCVLKFTLNWCFHHQVVSFHHRQSPQPVSAAPLGNCPWFPSRRIRFTADSASSWSRLLSDNAICTIPQASAIFGWWYGDHSQSWVVYWTLF